MVYNQIMKTIGIVALSGGVKEDKINNAVENLKALGYRVKLSENIFDKNRYLAGSDEIKIAELYKFFKDSDVDIILNARGGYGAIRLINQIDYEIIKSNPKPFIGFSDITALLLMIHKRTGMVTYHGPMACSDFGDLTPPPLLKGEGMMFSLDYLLKALDGGRLEFEGKKIYKRGEAQGIIWGGNLATVVSLCGLDFIPEEDFVFFAEDLNEPVYKIDRMFQQLINIQDFRGKCKGIVLGDFLDVDNKDWLDEYFYELAEKLNIPVVGGFKITHSKDKVTIPIGRKCSLHENQLVIG